MFMKRFFLYILQDTEDVNELRMHLKLELDLRVYAFLLKSHFFLQYQP